MVASGVGKVSTIATNQNKTFNVVKSETREKRETKRIMKKELRRCPTSNSVL